MLGHRIGGACTAVVGVLLLAVGVIRGTAFGVLAAVSSAFDGREAPDSLVEAILSRGETWAGGGIVVVGLLWLSSVDWLARRVEGLERGAVSERRRTDWLVEQLERQAGESEVAPSVSKENDDRG